MWAGALEILAAITEAAAGPRCPTAPTLDRQVRGARGRGVRDQGTRLSRRDGVGANALALSVLTPPYGAIYCHEKAHIEEDECCAPEFYAAGRS